MSRVELKKIPFGTKFLSVCILLGIAQFVQPKWNSTPTINRHDFLVTTRAPEYISELFKKNCYDCHSNRTNYSVVSRISPISWWVDSQIAKGKQSLNFSNWNKNENRLGIYWNAMRTAMISDIEHSRMPPFSYELFHKMESLKSDEKKVIIDWLYSLNFDFVPKEN